MPDRNAFFLGFIPIMLGTIALFLGLYANFGCETFQFPFVGNTGARIMAGLFSYKTRAYTVVGDTVWVRNVCASYDYTGFPYTTDQITSSVEGLAIAVAVIGGLAVIFSCIAPCCSGINDTLWRLLGIVYLICCILQGCTLMLYNSSICTDNPVIQFLSLGPSDSTAYDLLQNPNQCEWAAGYKMNISSVVFWFVAGISTCCFASPGSIDDQDEQAAAAAAEAEAAAEQPAATATDNNDKTTEEQDV